LQIENVKKFGKLLKSPFFESQFLEIYSRVHQLINN